MQILTGDGVLVRGLALLLALMKNGKANCKPSQKTSIDLIFKDLLAFVLDRSWFRRSAKASLSWSFHRFKRSVQFLQQAAGVHALLLSPLHTGVEP
jgi:hypothetical protein